MKLKNRIQTVIGVLCFLPSFAFAKSVTFEQRIDGAWTKIGATCLLPGQSIEPYLAELKKRFQDDLKDVTRMDIEGSRYSVHMGHSGNGNCVLSSEGKVSVHSMQEDEMTVTWKEDTPGGCPNDKGIMETLWVGDNKTYQLKAAGDYLLKLHQDRFYRGTANECQPVEVFQRPLVF